MLGIWTIVTGNGDDAVSRDLGVSFLIHESGLMGVDVPFEAGSRPLPTSMQARHGWQEQHEGGTAGNDTMEPTNRGIVDEGEGLGEAGWGAEDESGGCTTLCWIVGS
jgi:hypothetical protein